MPASTCAQRPRIFGSPVSTGVSTGRLSIPQDGGVLFLGQSIAKGKLTEREDLTSNNTADALVTPGR